MLTPSFTFGRMCPESGQSLIVLKDGRLWREVQFSLTYDGELLSASRSDPRLSNKNRIRFQLSDQLSPILVGGDWQRFRASALANTEAVRIYHGIGFVPVLSRKMEASCNLSIRLMCNDRPGAIVHGGDLDNRLKTLLDGLRMPANEKEVLKNLAPDRYRETEGLACACFLEDDALITKLTVETVQIMTELPKHHVRLVMDLEFRPFDFFF
jgi:hypothetical protein